MIRLAHFEFTALHRKHISQVVNGEQVSPGAKVLEFEQRFSALHGLKHGVMMNSGTDSLRVSLLALKEKYGWSDGDAVLVPALTFVATINTVIQAGLTPVLVDVSMHDFGINAFRYLPSEMRYVGEGMYEQHVHYQMPERARAIIPVHIAGQMCDMAAVMKLAALYKLKVIEDSCETMFASFDGKGCGTFGDVACFSTYAAHLITTGAGGLACTNDDELALLIRSYANHGRNVDYLPPNKAPSDISNRFRFDRIGYSCRSTELDAAVGCGELDDWESSIIMRRHVATVLLKRLDEHFSWLHLPRPIAGRTHSYMFFPIVLREGASLKKDFVVRTLEASGIETRDLLPILGQPCYAPFNWKEEDYPTARDFKKNAFYIPCHPNLSSDDIEHIGKSFDEISKASLTN